MLLYVSKVPIVVCLTSALPKILTEVETFGERCQGRVGDIILLTCVEAGQDGWHEERHDAGTRATDDRPVEKQPGEEAEAGGAPDPDQEQGVHYHLGGKQWDEEGEGEVGVEKEGVDNVAKKSSEHC